MVAFSGSIYIRNKFSYYIENTHDTKVTCYNYLKQQIVSTKSVKNCQCHNKTRIISFIPTQIFFLFLLYYNIN